MERNISEYVKDIEELLSGAEILAGQEARARALGEKLEDSSLTVAVIGQFKRGKTFLVNALLEREILPTGIVPITSVAAKISYGEDSYSVSFLNGLVKKVSGSEIGTYINEQENPDNRLGVDSVEISVPADFLEGGICLVDTPGIGSYHKKNTDAAYAFIRKSDAVIFLLSVDSPINEIEIDILRNTEEYAAKFFFAVNKIDTIGGEELKAYLNYCRELLCMLTGAEDLTLYPISAKEGTGLAELKAALNENLKGRLREILEKSAALKLKDIISCALSQIELYWKVLLMPPAVLKGSLKDMEQMLLEMREKAQLIVKELEADRDIIIPGLADTLDLRLNEFRCELSERLAQIFGMDYHYEISQLGEGDERPGKHELASKLGADFFAECERLCEELATTMKDVLMYRNESAVDVVTRIYSLNKLTRCLRRTLRILEGREDENPAPSTHPIKPTNLCP